MDRGRALLERLRVRAAAAASAPGRARERKHEATAVPRPEAAADEAIDEMHKIVETLRALSPKKQAYVCEHWPGAEIAIGDDLTVTARSLKERRRFVRAIDEDVMKWFSGFGPGDVFYDIGANCGSLTLAAGAMHREQIKIVAIEPGFANFDSLARNLSQNGMLGFVIPLQIALLDRTGVQAINYYRSTAAGTSLHAVGRPVDHEGNEFIPVETQMIPTYTLDDLIDVLKLPQPTRVKIDVDGSEGPLLEGAAKTLASGAVKELLVEVVDHDRAGTRLSCVQTLMEGHGYELTQTFRHGAGFVSDHLFRHDAHGRTSRPAVNGASIEQSARDALCAEHAAQETKDQRRRAKVAAAQERAAQKTCAAEAKVAAAQERAAQKAHAAEAKVAAAQERAAHKAAVREAAAQTEHDRERRILAERLARLRAELDELRESYYLSGARKKLDLRDLDGFSEIASEIVAAGRTGMNYDRLYTLWQAVHAAPPEHPIVEIGSYLGGSARFISETLQASGRTPRFYVCDTFAGHARTEPAIDTAHHDAGKFEDVSAEATAEYLAGYPALELIVGDIVETGPRLDQESFGLVHLDVDVYPATDFCLRFFAPRLAGGALMVIDDYGFITCPGVKQAADEFVAECPQFRLWHLLTGQAILARVAPDP